MFRWLVLIIFCLPLFSSGQTETFRGLLYERNSTTPVPNAHIKVRNSNQGTVAGYDGSFVLPLKSLPAFLDISCVGYEPFSLEVIQVQKAPAVLYLKPKMYDLNPVTISDKPVITLYKDDDYSVLDYDFLDENLMLLVYRYQLNRSEILLLNREGDTLVVTPVPAVPPLGLYKDVFANLHYVTKKNQVFQSFYIPEQNKLVFPYHTSGDTIRKFLGEYLFSLKDRLYFQESGPRGFMTSIGYYSRNEGHKYICKSMDFKGMKTYYSDAWNYHTTRYLLDPIDEFERRGVDETAIAYEHFYKKKNCGELFRIRDTVLAFFNFCENRIELMDADGHPVKTTTMDFRQDQSLGLLASITAAVAGSDGWKWSHRLIQDEAFQTIYAMFTHKGFVLLKKIDPESGEFLSSIELPVPFPEKLKIFKGEAYFLSKAAGEYQKRRLFKITLL